MFITIDKTHYFVNVDRYTGTQEQIARKVVNEVINRISTTRHNREKFKRKIYNQYIAAKG